MELVISIVDVVFDESSPGDYAIQSYTVEVTAEKDPNAQTPLAQVAEVPEPPWFYRDAPCGGKK